MKQVVCDTGALISLEKLPNGFALIEQLYEKLLLPTAVLDELTFSYDSHEVYLLLNN